MPSRSASVPWYGLASRITGHSPATAAPLSSAGRVTSMCTSVPSCMGSSRVSLTVPYWSVVSPSICV